METLSTQIHTLLSEHIQHSQWRQLRTATVTGPAEVSIDGNKLINFASNDYLGLSQHALLKQRAIEAIEKYGVGCPSSRLISGNCELYQTIESELAKLKGTEAALVFSSGFQANLTIMLSLSKLNSLLLCDKLSHNSILLGAQFNERNFLRFAHNNKEDLERLLEKQIDINKTPWVITESVFSMGDLAPVDEFARLCQKHRAHLYVDEAHATGVFGKNGMGLVNHPSEETVVMGTFGKGCGSFGAYVACSKQFKDFLVNFCSGIIYTTALPPAILGSIQAALELIPQMMAERELLQRKSAYLKYELNQTGFDTGISASHIICIYTGTSEQAISLSQYLEENKIYAPAIRPPTVPENTARIRLSLSAVHKDSDIEYLLKILRQWYVSKH